MEGGHRKVSTIKKWFSITAVSAIAVMAFGASSAFASDAAACQFQGLAGALVPPIPSAQHDAADGSLNDVENGNYTFSGSATCVKVDSDAGQATNSGVYSTSISAAGPYANTVCGTGTADGTASVTSPLAGWEGPVNANYHIQFVGGNGALTISSVSNSERSGGSGGGYVNIVPTNGGDCAVNDVAFFQVTGAFVAQG
jgi:hypothetical protein